MVLRQRHFIDSHKAFNAVAILGLMAWYDAWHNPTAWVYLALHGSYGVMWALKSATFGDKQWDQPTSIGYALVIWVGLSLYWVTPWLIASRDLRAPPGWMGMCVALYSLGVFLHFASDMQKFMHLRLRPGELLMDGLWARIRNPNYLGELLIYAGFSLLAMHWAPMVVLALFVVAVWIPNMVRKDRSLSRYPEFAQWKRRSKLLIPFVV